MRVLPRRVFQKRSWACNFLPIKMLYTLSLLTHAQCKCLDIWANNHVTTINFLLDNFLCAWGSITRQNEATFKPPNPSSHFWILLPSQWILDFLKVLYFFPGWLCQFKGLFIPVWRKIHRSKILPVTTWQLTNRKVSDISRSSRHSICQSIFPAWIYNMIQIHSGEASRPRHFVAHSVAVRPHALKLASLTFKNSWEVNL